MKNFIISIFLTVLLSPLCFSQNLEDSFSFIHNPEELVNWFSQEFKNQWEMPDYWQPPQEMLNSKAGDCEDFAILAQAVLRHLGYTSCIIIVKFKKMPVGHAICVFKDKTGHYSFISNQNLFSTGKAKFQDAMSKFYPDWQQLIFTNSKKQYLKIIRKDRIKSTTSDDIMTGLN